jgi:flagellar hook-basal body complex protein FliE
MSTVANTAIQAYARAAQTAGTALGDPASDAQAPAQDFASLVQDALGHAVEAGKEAETTSEKQIAGNGELVDVVTALTAAETSLDTIVAVRDRVISAYQEISRMPI